MEHSFLKDSKFIRDYLTENLSNEYSIEFWKEYIVVKKDCKYLLLKLIYKYFNNANDVLIEISFCTYDTNYYLNNGKLFYLSDKVFPYSEKEKNLTILSYNDEAINEEKLKKVIDCIEYIFNLDENHQPFLQRIVSDKTSCAGC